MNNLLEQVRALHKNLLIILLYIALWFFCSLFFFIHSNQNGVFIFTMSLFTCLLAVIAWIDYQKKIIPNELLILAIALRILHYLLMVFTPLYFQPAWIIGDILVGLASGFLLLIGKAFKSEVGWGDIKLMVVMGLYLGAKYTFSMLFYSVFASFIFAIGALITKKMTLKDAIPFAPFVLAGYIMAMIFA